MNTRTEQDLLGKRDVPADAYYGIHTVRALENFALGGGPVPPGLIRALALVKKACCLANRDLGYVPKQVADAIEAACDEIAGGGLADQFPLDALQGGAGTSTNMNMNEVIANRAIERLGGRKGDYSLVSPYDHVNLHQSTNDVYPTALRVAAILALRSLSSGFATLQGSFQRKEKEFAGIVKIGRTELQEAVPMTLGGEFSAFAEAFARDRWRTFKCEERLRVVNLGGTAIGTGLAAPRSYIFLAIEKLREVTGLGLARGENGLDATANADPLVEAAAILDTCAGNLVKVSNDLRLLHWVGEITLPPVQAGSSIMPGKINPVMAEAAIQAGLFASAECGLVGQAVTRSTFQIVEFMPLAARALLGAIEHLDKAAGLLSSHAGGIRANPGACRFALDTSPTLITAFVPYLGYERATDLIRSFAESGRTSIREFLAENLGTELVNRVLSPESVTALGFPDDLRKPL